MPHVSPESRKFRATDAQQLLENPMLQDAFSAVEKHLSDAELMCDPDNAAKALRIVISKQLLAAIKREITRVIQDGSVAEVQMQEIETKKRFSVFKR